MFDQVSEVIEARTDFSMVEETDDWLVVDKPAPLIVHPTSKKQEPTLLDELRMSLEQRGERSEGLSIINRLDRETSGLVLVARTPTAARIFGKAMMRRKIGKGYRAIVTGWPDWEELRVEGPLLRQGEVMESVIWLKQTVHAEGKPSVTLLRVAQRFERPEGKFSVLEVRTETGRTHQIRVHCSHVGHPIVGDKIYGPDERCYLEFMVEGWTAPMAELLHLPRQALHAATMQVEWEEEERCWEAMLPVELQEFLPSPAGSSALRD
jgi:23S rRNA pseudouridine1911/1915/1917 synthase